MPNLNLTDNRPALTEHNDNSLPTQILAPADSFVRRHIGPRPDEIGQMLEVLELPSLDALIEKTVPAAIRLKQPLQLPEAQSEYAALAKLKEIASKNEIFRSFTGTGSTTSTRPSARRRTPCSSS